MKNTLKNFYLPSVFKTVGLIAFAIVLFHPISTVASNKGSKFGGVQIGTITYSYRSMPDQSLNAVLNYVVQSGLSSVELMGDVAERFAGIPATKDPVAIRQWRTTVSIPTRISRSGKGKLLSLKCCN